MGWKNEAAVTVVSKTFRMKLLQIDIQLGTDPLVEKVKKHLTRQQAENICNKRSRAARAKTLIDAISSRMTTCLFVDFLDALGDYEICNMPLLRKAMLEAYETEGGELTPQMKQWMNGCSDSIECTSSIDSSEREIVIAESIVLEECVTTSHMFAADVVDFGEAWHQEEIGHTHQLTLECQISCFNEDRISKGKPMILATRDNAAVTDISDGLVSSNIVLYDLINKTERLRIPLVGHFDSILHCFAVEDGRYCFVSSKDSHESISATVYISLWPSGTYEKLDLEDMDCECIDKLSACVITSEEKAVLLIFSQDGVRVQVYFICDDQIEKGGSVEVTIEKITGVKCISFDSNHYCVFWGGQEAELFDVDTDIGLDPKVAITVELFDDDTDAGLDLKSTVQEISCCEFIPCNDALLLAVCYSDCSSLCSHSIDLWHVDQRTMRVHKTALQTLSMAHDTKMNLLFSAEASQLILSADSLYMLIAYNPDDRTLTEQRCVDVEATAPQGFLSQQKLLKSDDENMAYFVRCCDSGVVNITSIPL